MKKIIIILLGLFVATLVAVPLLAQVKIAADGSVQPTGNFAAMHGDYVDGVVLAKDTSDIPSYMLIADSTYTYFNNVVYAYDGSKWNSLEVVLPDSILYERDTVDLLATKYQLDTLTLIENLKDSLDFVVPTIKDQVNLGTSTNRINAGYFDEINFASEITLGTNSNNLNINNSGFFRDGNSAKLKMEAQNAYIEVGGILSGSSGVYIQSQSGSINFGKGGSDKTAFGSINNSNKLWNIDTLSINNSYAFPTIDGFSGDVLQTDGNGLITFQQMSSMLNLEDDGTGVVNSASGTGNFQWGNTIIDQQNILPATTGVGTVGSSSKRWDIVSTENLNLQTFSSNQTLVTSFVSFAPANGETSLDLGTGSQPWDIGYFNSLGSSSTSGHDSIDFRNNRISSVADPIYPQNAATKAYVDSQINSGTFTISNFVAGSNTASISGSDNNGHYIRIGDIVTFTVNISVNTDGTAIGQQYNFEFDPPIPSDFSSVSDLNGVATMRVGSANETGGLGADIGSDKIDVLMDEAACSSCTRHIKISGSYVVK